MIDDKTVVIFVVFSQNSKLRWFIWECNVYWKKAIQWCVRVRATSFTTHTTCDVFCPLASLGRWLLIITQLHVSTEKHDVAHTDTSTRITDTRIVTEHKKTANIRKSVDSYVFFCKVLSLGPSPSGLPTLSPFGASVLVPSALDLFSPLCLIPLNPPLICFFFKFDSKQGNSRGL